MAFGMQGDIGKVYITSCGWISIHEDTLIVARIETLELQGVSCSCTYQSTCSLGEASTSWPCIKSDFLLEFSEIRHLVGEIDVCMMCCFTELFSQSHLYTSN